MSIITREQQKQILIDTANHVINRDNTSPHSENLRELARIALASLEAEAVAWRYRYVHTPKTEEHGSPFTTEWKLCDSEDECNPSDCFERQPLYTAPPAPVSVPDRSMFEKWWESEHGSPLDSWDSLRTTDGYCDDGIDGQFEAWNACRAAMLQGAEPVTTAYKLRDAVEIIRNSGIQIDAEKIFAERDALNSPDCWCRTCRPITLTDMRFVVCPQCGNKRCPHANDHRNACTGSNEPGQEGSAYPAAPQQEVKP
ncbi:hypothetical protein [Enterobacter roggenkampii]|uniref:hypothetical protein n=1 Tax=Enterobacter roggenkampii TaxID=1812935 RepID=UPI0039C1DD49